MRMRQYFLVGYYFRSNMAAEHVVVTFGLTVEDAFDGFEGVQTKIKENLENNKFIFKVLEMFLNFTKIS